MATPKPASKQLGPVNGSAPGQAGARRPDASHASPSSSRWYAGGALDAQVATPVLAAQRMGSGSYQQLMAARAQLKAKGAAASGGAGKGASASGAPKAAVGTPAAAVNDPDRPPAGDGASQEAVAQEAVSDDSLSSDAAQGGSSATASRRAAARMPSGDAAVRCGLLLFCKSCLPTVNAHEVSLK